MDDKFPGFRETGFLPEAVINFLALLGWHPGGDRDLFHLEDLINLFSIENISKGGARFDYEKARWFNQKYIQTLDNETLATLITPHAAKLGYSTESDYLKKVAALMKDRVYLIPDFVHQGYYLFEKVKQYDSETIIHKWNPNLESAFTQLIDLISSQNPFESKTLEQSVKNFVQENKLKMGDVMPLLRIAFAGTMKGPAVFDMAEVLGKEETVARLKFFLHTFKG
jgi:glutamyl-tRNA synthetase